MCILQERLSVEIITCNPAFRDTVRPVADRLRMDVRRANMLAIVDDDDTSRSLVMTERLRAHYPEMKSVIVLGGGHAGPSMLYRDASIVAAGPDLSETLYHAARLSLDGLVVRPPEKLCLGQRDEIRARAAEGYRDEGDFRRIETLSPMERKVLRYLAEALSNKEIGRCLDISDNTVRIHMRSIFLKLGTQNRTQAALIATRYRHTQVLDDHTDEHEPEATITPFPHGARTAIVHAVRT